GTDWYGTPDNTFDTIYLWANDLVSIGTSSHIDGYSGLNVLTEYTYLCRHSNFAIQAGSLTGLDFRDGKGVFKINNAGVVPTSSPSSGIILYVDNDNLKIRRPDDSVLTIAENIT